LATLTFVIEAASRTWAAVPKNTALDLSVSAFIFCHLLAVPSGTDTWVMQLINVHNIKTGSTR